MKVLAFGEILWDIIEGKEHLGGAAFNFAAHMAQCGNHAQIISRLGSDHRGNAALSQSLKCGVDVSFIQQDAFYPTGIVDVTLNDGQPEYVIRPNAAFDYISANPILPRLKSDCFDIFYFGSLAQRNVVSEQALYRILSGNDFKHIFYDVNLRKSCYSEKIIKNSLAACTIFKLNKDEVITVSRLLTGYQLSEDAFCSCVKSLYPAIRIIIITASESGCFIYESDLQYLPGTPVTVCDAVGSGDAFSASFMHIYAASGDAVMSAKVANQVGAFVATQAGAIPKYSDEIVNVLKENIKLDLSINSGSR
jgi:fructokinase